MENKNKVSGCPVNVEEGTAYKLKKKATNGVVYALYWYLGLGLVTFFKSVRASPNFVSALSLVFYVVAGYSFFNSFFIFGGIALFLGILMDATDGKLARVTGKTSHLGVWLDYNFDNLKPLFIYPPIAFALFETTGDLSYFAWAFVAMNASLIYVIINLKWQGFDFSSEVKDDYVNKSKLHLLLKQFYFYDGIEPLVVILFAYLHIIEWYLILWAIGLTLMYLILACYGGLMISKKAK